jgi:hypothetical protein
MSNGIAYGGPVHKNLYFPLWWSIFELVRTHFAACGGKRKFFIMNRGFDIEKLAEEEGKKIADVIYEKYGEDPIVKHKSFFGSFFDELLGGGISRLKVEKQIYNRALHEATAFFLENSNAKFDDNVNEVLKYRVSIRSANPKRLEKATPEELLANVILIEALDAPTGRRDPF